MIGINFIHKKYIWQHDLLEALFGPDSLDDKVILFDDTWDMANIHVEAGLAKSVTQARKQGMGGDIPMGFTIGREKNKHPEKNFWILR